MRYEWDPDKAAINLKTHGVDFADASLALEDPRTVTIVDPDKHDEERFISLSSDPYGRILVTVYAYRGETIRIISSRKASRGERLEYERIR